jgi:hypothetical protein
MLIGRIEGATRLLGKSQGYFGLPVRDQVVLDPATGQKTPEMVSAWIPTDKEMAAIADGAPIHLRVLGEHHPPVEIEVGEIPS